MRGVLKMTLLKPVIYFLQAHKMNYLFFVIYLPIYNNYNWLPFSLLLSLTAQRSSTLKQFHTFCFVFLYASYSFQLFHFLKKSLPKINTTPLRESETHNDKSKLIEGNYFCASIASSNPSFSLFCCY